MLKVAKLVIIDPDDKYLLMYRSDHPAFGTDPDLPGGTLEGNETLLEAVLREAEEEAGINIKASVVNEIYSGTDYSDYGSYYGLFAVKLKFRPDIILSWEHSKYEWLDRSEFISRASRANDTYMHMVAELLNTQSLD